jgi:NADPH-dependent curcumin reductase CurA
MAAANSVNRQWRLKSRPTGLIKADNFELVSQPMPEPGKDQLLIRQRISLPGSGDARVAD